MSTDTITIREDLDEHLTALDIHEITKFEGFIERHPDDNAGYRQSFTARVVSGGFGLPHVIVSCHTELGWIELALIESDGDDPSYEQDGDDPLQVDGWAFRLGEAHEMLSEGWCAKLYDDVHDALLAARAALAAEEGGPS